MGMACWRPAKKPSQVGVHQDKRDRQDPLLWYQDLCPHATGEFSYAVIQANAILEDMSQVETGVFGTFVGVYDGHGGPEASRSIRDTLYNHIQKFKAEEEGIMSSAVLRKAFKATEDRFFEIVRKGWLLKPQLAATGSCCLAGMISDSNLYIANVGDARAVLGTYSKDTGSVVAKQLSKEHNVSIQAVREELIAKHFDDPQIVLLKQQVWRVKGLIQVSRSIGDFYLKKPEYNREPLTARFRLPEPLKRPVMSADPECAVYTLGPRDEFIIFASDGLWEHLSNQEAVDIICSQPRQGIARRLIKAAMQEAARKREMRYTDLKGIERGIRRHFHDDITVIVVFLDPTNNSHHRKIPSHHISVKCPVDTPQNSRS